MAVYGSASSPSQNTINYDAILSTSLFNYQRTLTDNISKSNAFFYKIQEHGMYTALDGGVAIQIPLMYALGTFDWYDSYDTLATDPTDGITSAFFDWRQAAVPVSISRKEERQNSSTDRIVDLLKAKILQAELGIKQGFNQSILQGSYASGGINLFANASSLLNGSLGVEPIYNLVNPNTTASIANPVVGGINYVQQSWWNNQFTQSALSGASKSSDFLNEAQRVFNNCSKGPGGPPDLCLVDQTTYEIWNTAYYQVYRRTADTMDDFPFPNIKFHNCIVTWDEFVPDVMNNTVTPLTGVGTALFLNTNFLHVKYDTESNFVATPFIKPVNQDARVAHILWMGNLCVSNRRKQGVWFNIPRTLTWVV
jgi:hypothetical protein